jgi:hypothetical protein
MFDLDPSTPSYEAKGKILSHQVDNSHISDDQFCWSFSIPSPTISAPPSGTFSLAGSQLGHQSFNGQSTGKKQNFVLIVTINRRGRLNSNIAFVITISYHERSLTLCFDFRRRQEICFIHPPDPTTLSSPTGTPVSVSPPQDPPVMTPWKEQPFPPVLLRGVMFGQFPVEVECKVGNTYQIMTFVRLSLPRSSLHPYVIPDDHFWRCLRSLTYGILRYLTL